MYKEDIENIYGELKNRNKKEKDKAVTSIIDSEGEEELGRKRDIINITNNVDNLIDDGLNIVLESFDYDESLGLDVARVKDFRGFKLNPDNVDEIIIDVLDMYSLEDSFIILNNLLPSLRMGGEIYIEGNSLKNILDFYFTPGENNNNTITLNTLMLGVRKLFYGKNSVIIPELLVEILEANNIKSIMTKDSGIRVMVKGLKSGDLNDFKYVIK
jgi:hypothetical protein